MLDCKGCPHEGYCIPDDCGLLNKKEPPSVGAEGGSLCKTVTMFTVSQKER